MVRDQARHARGVGSERGSPLPYTRLGNKYFNIVAVSSWFFVGSRHFRGRTASSEPPLAATPATHDLLVVGVTRPCVYLGTSSVLASHGVGSMINDGVGGSLTPRVPTHQAHKENMPRRR
jgi:hypothetical protein